MTYRPLYTTPRYDLARLPENQRIDALEREAFVAEERALTDGQRDERRARWVRQNPNSSEARTDLYWPVG